MKKLVAITIFLLFLSISLFPISSGNKSSDNLLKTITRRSIDTILPPLMWTENFSTLYIEIPGDTIEDVVYYCIDWGDGNQEWIGPYGSNETVSINIWNSGNYKIKIKAKYFTGEESKWATYILISSSDFKIFHVSIGYIGINYIFTIYWKDCVYYMIDWGDGSSSGWIGPYPDIFIMLSHEWSNTGEYIIRLRGKDLYGNESDWMTFSLTILGPGNNPPGKPVGSGPINGKVGVDCFFSFVSIDPDEDNVSYYIDWGDDTSEEKGPFESGLEIIVNHTWYERGCYIIRCKAIDSYGAESDWLVRMFWIGRSKILNNSIILWFLPLYQLLNKLIIFTEN